MSMVMDAYDGVGLTFFVVTLKEENINESVINTRGRMGEDLLWYRDGGPSFCAEIKDANGLQDKFGTTRNKRCPASATSCEIWFGQHHHITSQHH